jgi:hypothetical protein
MTGLQPEQGAEALKSGRLVPLDHISLFHVVIMLLSFTK